MRAPRDYSGRCRNEALKIVARGLDKEDKAGRVMPTETKASGPLIFGIDMRSAPAVGQTAEAIFLARV